MMHTPSNFVLTFQNPEMDLQELWCVPCKGIKAKQKQQVYIYINIYKYKEKKKKKQTTAKRYREPASETKKRRDELCMWPHYRC
jgi:hypothetical protein